MRVICIDASPREYPKYPCLIKEGQEYDVSEEPELKGYHVKGVTPHGECPYRVISYKKDRFVPLSEIDERELSHAEPIESTFSMKEV